MSPPLQFPTTPTQNLQRAVDDAHALAKTLFARATRLRDSGQADAARGDYALGNLAFAIGLRTELALERLEEDTRG
jgi:hypothetical protein